ncbi:hypothetical protein ACLX1H_001090 [Fusarium chlamydosporum]
MLSVFRHISSYESPCKFIHEVELCLIIDTFVLFTSDEYLKWMCDNDENSVNIRAEYKKAWIMYPNVKATEPFTELSTSRGVSQDQTFTQMDCTISRNSNERVGEQQILRGDPYEDWTKENWDHFNKVSDQREVARDLAKQNESLADGLEQDNSELKSQNNELKNQINELKNQINELKNQKNELEEKHNELALQSIRYKAMQRDIETQTDPDEKGNEPEVEPEDVLQEKPVEEEQENKEDGDSGIMMLEKAKWT